MTLKKIPGMFNSNPARVHEGIFKAMYTTRVNAGPEDRNERKRKGRNPAKFRQFIKRPINIEIELLELTMRTRRNKKKMTGQNTMLCHNLGLEQPRQERKMINGHVIWSLPQGRLLIADRSIQGFRGHWVQTNFGESVQ
jgi:hypothetical protein